MAGPFVLVRIYWIIGIGQVWASTSGTYVTEERKYMAQDVHCVVSYYVLKILRTGSVSRVIGIYYQKENGLKFSEEFWMTQERLMLRFALRIESEDAETLYYGMISEKMAHNVWKEEAGEEYRYDSEGKKYGIYGGEVGVIYPGDCADEWYTAKGIC